MTEKAQQEAAELAALLGKEVDGETRADLELALEQLVGDLRQAGAEVVAGDEPDLHSAYAKGKYRGGGTVTHYVGGKPKPDTVKVPPKTPTPAPVQPQARPKRPTGPNPSGA
jgi:Asp-tRNA(Asn)/Glu-tRNA(Gln) amidotransferase A subunit family amidase